MSFIAQHQTMKTRFQANTRNHVKKDGAGDSKFIKLRGEIMLGSVIWVRMHNGSWWPSQVVNENVVSGRIKPNKKLLGEVLVRLYGTYTYLYANPMKCRSEFEDILKQNNGSYRETFLKSLEQDISQLKSRSSKRVSKLREKSRAEAPKDKMPEQVGTKESQAEDNPSSHHGNLRKLLDGRTHRSRTKKVDNVAENSNGEVPRNGKTKQESVKRINKGDNRISAKSCPEKPELASAPQTGVKRRRLSSEKAGVEASKNAIPKQDGIQKRHKSNHQQSANSCPEKPLLVSAPQTRVKRGHPSLEKAGVEASKNGTPKQDGVQKKHKSNHQNSANSCPEKPLLVSAPQTRVKRGHPSLEKAGVEASKNGTPKQDGVQKKHKSNHQNSAKSCPEKSQLSAPQRGLKPGHLSLEKAGVEASKNGTSKQDGIQKRHKSNHQNSAKSCPEKPQLVSAQQTGVKHGHPSSEKAGLEASKKGTPKQDGTQKRRKSNHRNSAKSYTEKPQLDSAQTGVECGDPSSEKADVGASKSGTPKQDDIQKRHKSKHQNSVIHSSKKSSELSVRRIRVMQSLGLIAPCGSPFHRNGIMSRTL